MIHCPCTTVILEGTAMSLCSKVMHPDLASGTFNSGLLSTQAGTVGRLFGNFIEAAISKFTGDEQPQQLKRLGEVLFSFMGLLTAGSLAYTLVLWKRLAC